LPSSAHGAPLGRPVQELGRVVVVVVGTNVVVVEVGTVVVVGMIVLVVGVGMVVLVDMTVLVVDVGMVVDVATTVVVVSIGRVVDEVEDVAREVVDVDVLDVVLVGRGPTAPRPRNLRIPFFRLASLAIPTTSLATASVSFRFKTTLKRLTSMPLTELGGSHRAATRASISPRRVVSDATSSASVCLAPLRPEETYDPEREPPNVPTHAESLTNASGNVRGSLAFPHLGTFVRTVPSNEIAPTSAPASAGRSRRGTSEMANRKGPRRNDIPDGYRHGMRGGNP